MNILGIQNEKFRLWPILLSGVLFLFAGTALFLHYLPCKTPAKISVSQKQTLLEISSLKSLSQYQKLRSVDVLDNQFILLKHKPTAQRIMIIFNKQNDQSIYQSMFSQTLTPTTFGMLIQLFKRHTQFEHKNIQIDQVAPTDTGFKETKHFKISYRHFDIRATVNQKPQYFEAYLGKIEEGPAISAVLFTFNSRHDASLAPITDLTQGLETTK